MVCFELAIDLRQQAANALHFQVQIGLRLP
jgi:hypothetical protein